MMNVISIETWRDPSALERVHLRDDVNAIVRSERLAGVMRNGLRDGAVIVAALDGRALVGSATLVPSKLLAGRWRGLADVHELGALEVAAGMRRRGIATRILGELAEAIPLRTSIVLARGSLHDWDFDAAGLTALGYRRMLMKLLSRAGFVPTETDDPEVTDHPLNFLALRYGEEASSLAMYQVSQRLDAREISEFARSA